MAKKDKAKAMAKGMSKKVKEMLSGDGAIFSELAKDHAMVSELMESVTETDDIDKRRALYPEIRNSLLSHAVAEQRQFYMPLTRYEETRSLTETSMQDHDEIEELIASIDRLDYGEQRWMSLFRQLQNAVEVHVETEENELFPRAQKVLTKDEIKEMHENFKADKKEIRQRLESGMRTEARPEH